MSMIDGGGRRVFLPVSFVWKPLDCLILLREKCSFIRADSMNRL